MEWTKQCVRHVWWRVLFSQVVLFGALYTVVLWRIQQLEDHVPLLAHGVQAGSPWVETLARLEQQLGRAFPQMGGLFLAGAVVASLLTWLCFRWGLLRFAPRQAEPEAVPAKGEKPRVPSVLKGERTEASQRGKEEDQRRSLQLLSLLQREGRLMDFLAEDLGAYDDAQIGAAVRGVHGTCKALVQKYLAPEAIMEQNEGDTVTVPPGFDAASIKLTGNVSGDPPFTGILQHRGWKATRFDMPSPAGKQDHRLIAPAEVEIT